MKRSGAYYECHGTHFVVDDTDDTAEDASVYENEGEGYKDHDDTDDCDHDEVDPQEGCLDCGAAYHEVRNTDPDMDMER